MTFRKEPSKLQIVMDTLRARDDVSIVKTDGKITNKYGVDHLVEISVALRTETFDPEALERHLRSLVPRDLPVVQEYSSYYPEPGNYHIKPLSHTLMRGYGSPDARGLQLGYLDFVEEVGIKRIEVTRTVTDEEFFKLSVSDMGDTPNLDQREGMIATVREKSLIRRTEVSLFPNEAAAIIGDVPVRLLADGETFRAVTSKEFEHANRL